MAGMTYNMVYNPPDGIWTDIDPTERTGHRVGEEIIDGDNDRTVAILLVLNSYGVCGIFNHYHTSVSGILSQKQVYNMDAHTLYLLHSNMHGCNICVGTLQDIPNYNVEVYKTLGFTHSNAYMVVGSKFLSCGASLDTLWDMAAKKN